MLVSNSSPLINLAAIKKIHLLRDLYNEIIIPAAVWEEVVIRGKGQPGSDEVKKAGWIKKDIVHDLTLLDSLHLILDKGESESIALAKEKKAELLLIDEIMARKVAHHLGLSYIGILGVLREAKSKGLIKSVKKQMNSLRTVAGFWISDIVYNGILKLENEL